MVRVGLLFDLRHCDTQPGESLCVRGNLERLGRWTTTSKRERCLDHLRLHTDPQRYPRWSSRAPIWLEPEVQDGPTISFQYKYLKDRSAFCEDHDKRSNFLWEAFVENRWVSLPVADGAIFVVSDEIWNEEGQTVITQLRRAKEARHVPVTLPPQDKANWSFILSPRGTKEEDTQFPIEKEFGALDSPERVQTAMGHKCSLMEKQTEALRLENALLRKRLQNMEAAVSSYHVDMTDSTDEALVT